MTITEALAELKTLQKRIEKKRAFCRNYVARQECYKDPLESSGGSRTAIARERQAIKDLEERIVRIRTEINIANMATFLDVLGETRTVAEWIIWRREVAPGRQGDLQNLIQSLQRFRDDANRRGSAVVSTDAQATKQTDFIVNINEQELIQESERLEEILGVLDGLLSLKNATTTLTLPPSS